MDKIEVRKIVDEVFGGVDQLKSMCETQEGYYEAQDMVKVALRNEGFTAEKSRKIFTQMLWL